MRHGIHLDVQHAHEWAHLRPLAKRLKHLRASNARSASLVLSAASRTPAKGAWNVQIFHGLGDKGYTLNPLFLQQGRFPRTRTVLTMAARRLRLPFNFLQPPADPGQRPSRYEQVNAYGPRFRDALSDMLDDVVVSEFGHVALNERGRIQTDRDGPLLWMPTWDNRRFMGGPNQSSLATFAHEVALISRHIPVQVKIHPLTHRFNQDRAALEELERAPGVTLLEADGNPYELLAGARALLTDTSSLGFEAYCMGVPVGVAKPPRVKHSGLHAELADRTHVLRSGRPDLLHWAEAPPGPRDAQWMRDLLYAPAAARNDAFAADLEARATDEPKGP